MTVPEAPAPSDRPPQGPLLALDASADACAAALVGPALRLARAEPMARGQAERLIPLVQELMAEAGLDWPAITAVAAARGPGSFTGVRVGVAAARALALALERPALGVDVDDALAAACAAARPDETGAVAVCLGRGPRRIWRGYRLSGGRACAATDIQRGDPPADAWPIAIGPAVEEAAPDRARSGFERVDPLVLADLAVARLTDGPPFDPLRPRYLRPPDADPSSVAPPARLGPRPGGPGGQSAPRR